MPSQRKTVTGRFEVPAPDLMLVNIARGLRHELGNILTPVMAFGEMLTEVPRLDSQAMEDLEAINQSARRGAEFVDRLAEAAGLASVDMSKMTLLDLAETIEEGWESESLRLRMVITRGRESKHLPEEADTPVDADINLVRKMVSELARNSEMAEAENVLISVSVLGGDTLMRVTDDGPGVDGPTLAKMAQPYWTTQYAKNRGLGLAVVNGLVNAQGGRMALESDPLAGGLSVELQWPNGTDRDLVVAVPTLLEAYQ